MHVQYFFVIEKMSFHLIEYVRQFAKLTKSVRMPVRYIYLQIVQDKFLSKGMFGFVNLTVLNEYMLTTVVFTFIGRASDTKGSRSPARNSENFSKKAPPPLLYTFTPKLYHSDLP